MHGWYAAARIAGAKGLEGKLRLTYASAFLRSAHVGDVVAFVPPTDKGSRFSKVSAFESMGDDACIASFEGIASADASQALVGSQVLLTGQAPKDREAPEGLDRLMGYTVHDDTLADVGIIELIDDGPDRFQPLAHLRCQGREDLALIPLADELIVDIDDAQKQVRMTLPAGLLDL